ncbi:hypothetical protein Tco_0654722 [Tanacetum coccineum]|uniref:Uncharacterized protein n=1 Tax=Tanacetum coccineum TaxID=301880 RepID=A0ABQ4X406_9ASTR
MRSDELYKFSDRTLTGLRTLLDNITKNIQMEYLPKRRWSTLEKKRANIMIKAIDKQLKERRMMRILRKFIGGRHYGTDLRLLQPYCVHHHKSNTKVIHNDDENPFRANIKQALGRFNTTAGNPVKEILLKLNLPYRRSILIDLKEYIKMDMKRQSVKVKELQERCIIKDFKLLYQEKYEHVGPKSQDHKKAKDHKMMIRDYSWLMISKKF